HATRSTRAARCRAALYRRPAAAPRRGLDHLRLGHEATLGEAPGVEDAERLVLSSLEYGLGEDPSDRGRVHEAVTAETGGDPHPVAHAAENRLVIGRHVVEAFDDLG